MNNGKTKNPSICKRFFSVATTGLLLFGISLSCSNTVQEVRDFIRFTPYLVEHYQQDVSGSSYTLVLAEKKSGNAQEFTAATTKNYEGFTAKEIEQEKIAKDGSTVVRIEYDRKLITLTFDLDGGTTQAELDGDKLTGVYGTYVEMENPTKKGYTFTGWNKELPVTFPTEDADYKALWIREGDYRITYNLDGGTNHSGNPTSYNVESETITLQEASRTGYTFAGWENSNGDTVTQIATGTTGDITLTAKWNENYLGFNIIASEENDIPNIEKPVIGGTEITFVAPQGYKTYAWYLDGVMQTETATWTLDSTTTNAGSHFIMLVVTDTKDRVYSAQYELEVTK